MSRQRGGLGEALLSNLQKSREKELGFDRAKSREPEFQERKNHLKSKARAEKLFERIMENEEGAIHDAKGEGPFQCAFEYKGRMLHDASVLHMALWMEATQKMKYSGLVQKLVREGINMHQRAYYKSKSAKDDKTSTTRLHAMAIASGLGKVELLDAVAEGISESLQSFLNKEDLVMKDDLYFYCPLHDACFLGRSRAIVWLISNGADPDKPNSGQITGLHMFVGAGACEGTKAEVKEAIKKLRGTGAPLTKKAKPIRDSESQDLVTPMQMATAHDSNFPKKLIFLLSPAFQAINKPEARGLMFDSSSDSLSIIDDLLTLAKTSPQAADELAREIFVAKDRRKKRAQEQLIKDVQQEKANFVLKLASVMCAAPNAAAEILAALTAPPKIQDPSHYPLRNRTSLVDYWRDLGRPVSLRGVYSADALRGQLDLLEPTWFYGAQDKSKPKWHESLIPIANDATYRQSMYDVQTSVVMVPDLLTIDMVHALATTQEITVFQRLAITGIVTCLWNSLAYLTHSLEILSLAGFELAPLLGWGMSVGEEGEVFDRLWRPSTNATQDLSHNSPASVPFIWSVLAGVWLKNAIEFVCRIIAHIHKWYVTQDHDPFDCRPQLQRWAKSVHLCPTLQPCLQAVVDVGDKVIREIHKWYVPHYPKGYANTGIWRIGQLMEIDFVPFYALKLLLLGRLMWETAAFQACSDSHGNSHGTICYSSQALLTANISICVIQMIFALRALKACGPRVLAIVGSFASGAMIEMLFIMAFSYMSFIFVLASLQRGHTVGWESIYLYRGLIFGDGDGLDRLAITSETDDDNTGEPQQHGWITLYGVIFTMLFNIVFMNLIIAIYGDEYKDQQKKADLAFLKTRSSTIARNMLKYQSLGKFLGKMPHRVRGFPLSIVFLFVWILAVIFADNEPELYTCFFSAIFFTLWQLTFFVCVSNATFTPHDSPLKKSGVECHVVRATLASQKVLELRVAIRCHAEHNSEQWQTALNASNLAADSYWPVRVQPVPHKPSLVIDGEYVDREDFGRYYEATLGFEIESHHTDVLTYSFETPNEEPGSVQFLLPRFLWVCYREDFDEERYTAKRAKNQEKQ